MEKEILVIIGTSNIAIPLNEMLKKSGINYRVLASNETNERQLKAKGVRTIRGSLEDLSILKVDTIFLRTRDNPRMLEIHKAFIDWAVKSGIRKIVRLSAHTAEVGCDIPLYDHHGKADEYLKQSGLDYIILRPHYCMNNILDMHSKTIKHHSMFAQYSGDARIPMVDARDIAKVAYQCLISDEFNNQTFYITGPHAINFFDVARALTKSYKRNIHYIRLSLTEQKADFQSLKVDEWVGDSTLEVFKLWANYSSRISLDFERITNSEPRDIFTFANDVCKI